MLRLLWARPVLICLALAATIAVPHAQAPATGSITGRVVDSLSGQTVPGAIVLVDKLNLSAITDRLGDFRITGVPSGAREIVVTFLGRKPTHVPIEVRAGASVEAIVKLEAEAGYEESVTVTALQRDAQERALNQQKTAPNITNVVSADQIGHFPDPNAAEVTSRVPGISIQRDQGEGRYVIIRGTEPRLNSMMINGERIPSPDPDFRQVALDVIPADLLQAVEVSKALTPDMDGDAIGGAVNLVTKQAPERFGVFGSIGGGFNNSLGSYDQHNANITIGKRFDGNKIGLVFGASTNGTKRGNEDFEPVYTTGNLTDLDLRSYTVVRRRHGATGTVDFRPRTSAHYTAQGMYNYFIDDNEERQRWRNRIANRRLERELRDRTHVEHIWSASIGGHHDLGRAALDFHFQGAHSDQRDPGTIATTFRQSNVNFAPNVTPTSIDPDNVQANPLNENLSAYTFNSQVRAINANDDRDIVAAADLRFMMTQHDGLLSFLKFGVKYRDKNKERTRDEVTLASSATIPLSAVLEADGATHTLLDARYTFGPFINMIAADNLRDSFPMTSTVNHARDSEDSVTGEQVTSGYAMAELYIGPKMFLLPGVRVEHTAADYAGNVVNFSPNGTWLSTTPVSGSTNYTTLMPGANLRYAINDDLNLRAAVTRTLARPNYINLIPFRTFDDQNNTIMLGNPELRPTLAWNTDFMVERYLKSVGIISAGVFYKKLHDYIYTFTSNETVNNEQFTVTQPLNGEDASIRGLELAIQSYLRFLPKPFDGIGVYANYTLTDSTAVFPGRTGEQATLPGQSRNVGNLSISYEKAGFSGRVAVNFHGSYVDQVAAAAGQDRFYDTHKQVDISINQRITRNIHAYFDALNLSDSPNRYFQGVADRPLQEEHFQWWATFGVKLNWVGR